MIKNYIITALRSLIRNHVTSAINITGLASGIAASILILLYAFSELSVDRLNENYENIYRLEIGDFVVNGTAQPVRIIGVVNDFHFRSLQEPIGPLVLGLRPGNLGLANIRIA